MLTKQDLIDLVGCRLTMRAKSLADESVPGPMDAILRQLAPSVRRRFLQAVDAAQGAVDLQALADQIAQGHLTTAEALTRLDVFRDRLDGLFPALQQGFLLGAAAAAEPLAARGLVIRLDLVNPRATAWMRSHGGDLLTAVTEESRQAIQTVLSEAFARGVGPRDLARQLRPIIGLTERQAVAVTDFRARLTQEGVAAEAIDARAEKLAAAYARQRAETVARTETLTASHQGQRALWDEAVRQDLIPADQARVWMATDDERLCPQCEALDGQTAALDEPFDDGTQDAPAHVDCRCDVSLSI